MKIRHFGAVLAATAALTLGFGGIANASPYNWELNEDSSSDVLSNNNISILPIQLCEVIDIPILSPRNEHTCINAPIVDVDSKEDNDKVWLDKSKKNVKAKTYVKAKKKAYGESNAEAE